MAKKKEEEVEDISDFKKLKAKFEKDYGKGSLMRANETPQKMDVISTGSITLNKALGVLGLPKGRVVEIYGPESSGKTTLCQAVIAEAQKANPETYCAIVDAEHALDIRYLESMGVDLSRTFIPQPDYGEQALEMARDLITSGLYSV